MIRIFIFFSTLFISLTIAAQDVPIGGWKEHLSYKSGISVTEGNGKVYCATLSGIFSLNKADNSMDRLSKINGLSDVEANKLNFNKYNNKLLISYKNSNIDIVDQNGSITNISDIKRKSILGNKAINNIFFVNQFAYLSCGFGIVVIDMDRLEVKDTYYIGPGGAAINVNDFTSDGILFYAATSAGVYTATVTNPNLANFFSWQKITMPYLHSNHTFNTIATFNGNLFVNLSKLPSYYEDTLFVFNGISWKYFDDNDTAKATTYSLSVNNNQLVIVQEGSVLTYNASLINTGAHQYYYWDYLRPKAAVLDNTNTAWIADSKYGLVSYNPSKGWASNYPNGPASPKVFNMAISEGNLWVAPGGRDPATYLTDGLYNYSDGEWKNPRGNYPTVINFDTIFDFVNVLVDPNNPKRTYASSWAHGVVELYNGTPIKLYGSTNSTLEGNIGPNAPIWVDGLAIDENDNLWVANSGQSSSLAVKKSNGTWLSIDLSDVLGIVPAVKKLGKMIIDKNDQKWVLFSQDGDGIMVYKAGTTANAINNVNAKKLTEAPGSGALPSTTVFCLAEDLDGEIWIGTDKGVAVFYSPENVFTGGNYDAQQILIEQDGHVQILLETEAVQAIAVDDANRKWIGTSKSGVFLMSADGTQQIYHFNIDNSPLLSNNVKNIVIDHATGEIYFGTDKGLIAYRGTATQGLEEFTDVYSFPNPVKPDYSGPIAIKGLVTNTIVKITDISGSLVFETKSEGGQAIWYGKNFNGEKVSSGVYMVFCASEDGSQKLATKILLIN